MVSIVILTWNSRALLAACLEALPAATASIPTEVIVVDNGSRDGTAELLARHHGLVTITNATNRGRGAGPDCGPAPRRDWWRW